MTTRVGTANIRDTLPHDVAKLALRKVLAQGKPDMLGVPEWRWPMLDVRGHQMARPRAGGPPLVYDADRYTLKRATTRTLVGSGRVGRMAGRKSVLPASRATVYTLTEMGHPVVVIVCHLTAEVQRGKGYRRDRAHALRVARHRAERAHLAGLVRFHRARGRRVFVVGDTNFDSMPLPPLVSCWRGRSGRTLGSRAVDAVFADRRADSVMTIPTASDHDAVVATYREP